MRTVSRSAWGAREPTGRTPLDTQFGIAVHYSAANADEQAEHRNCAARVRAIQTFHMTRSGADPTKPWADIAYNWIICKHGYVFVGRGKGIRSAANGTDAGNDHYPAVCFLGDDTANRDDVTDAGRVALVELIGRELGRAGYPRKIRPHSTFKSTACPGDELRRFCAELERAVMAP